MLFAAEFEPALIDIGRSAPRAPVSLDARIGRGGLDRALCRVNDISTHGARLETYSTLKSGAMIWLTLPTIGSHCARIVWATEFEAGCQFLTPLEERDFLALIDINEAIGKPRYD